SGGCSFSSSQHPISIQVLHLKLESKLSLDTFFRSGTPLFLKIEMHAFRFIKKSLTGKIRLVNFDADS
ncbi:hypothetical protein, partial [Burkholderia ubonensis]|uniref:hypothetical protein n=1 Tax=Burkholderia ubonensis TaxID=101571 RepID=UPI001E60A40E